ncbi:MAG: prepilin peptidase [Candidatus Lokiarchaeota archaeon]|nr:prepilin peptidase [Candidatus Lokiarchaeota archaeon]
MISTLIFLLHLSLIDVRYNRISNFELIPLFMISIYSLIYRIISQEYKQIIVFLVIQTIISTYLYVARFIGPADYKIIIALSSILDPTSSYGITSNLDGVQFYYYFILIFLFFCSVRILLNRKNARRSKYLRNPSLNMMEMLFLYCFYQLSKLQNLPSGTVLLLEINSKLISIQNAQKISTCWVRRIIPIVPYIALSLILTIFS